MTKTLAELSCDREVERKRTPLLAKRTRNANKPLVRGGPNPTTILDEHVTLQTVVAHLRRIRPTVKTDVSQHRNSQDVGLLGENLDAKDRTVVDHPKGIGHIHNIRTVLCENILLRGAKDSLSIECVCFDIAEATDGRNESPPLLA